MGLRKIGLTVLGVVTLACGFYLYKLHSLALIGNKIFEQRCLNVNPHLIRYKNSFLKFADYLNNPKKYSDDEVKTFLEGYISEMRAYVPEEDKWLEAEQKYIHRWDFKLIEPWYIKEASVYQLEMYKGYRDEAFYMLELYDSKTQGEEFSTKFAEARDRRSKYVGLYEDIFDRIPLSLVKYSWFLENISTSVQKSYDIGKRLMDIVLSFILGVISLVFYPFVWIAIKIEDRGALFFVQERMGQNNKIVKVVKFRSLAEHSDEGGIAKDPKPTKVGQFIRRTRIDELPQLWNVIKGDISIIGPRPELPNYVKKYSEEIPYYSMRHIIKPGLSGWAQIYQDNHPHHGVNTFATAIKLSYDLYYIKNHSFLLDIKIALRTLKTLASIAGR